MIYILLIISINYYRIIKIQISFYQKCSIIPNIFNLLQINHLFLYLVSQKKQH